MSFLYALIITVVGFLPVLVEAANPLASKVVVEMVHGLVSAVIYIGTPVLAVFIVWTGFLFVAAQGSAEGITKAKKMALQVTIGGVLLLSLWAIVTLVSNTLAELSAVALLLVLIAFFLYVRSRG